MTTNFDVNIATSECMDLFEKAKGALEDYNKLASDYNVQVRKLLEYCKKAGDSAAEEYLKQILTDKLNNIKIQEVSTDEDFVMINPDDIKSIEDKDNHEDNYDYEDKYAMDDFSFQQGSNTRALKGTGKGNYKDVFNKKHVRKVAERF